MLGKSYIVFELESRHLNFIFADYMLHPFQLVVIKGPKFLKGKVTAWNVLTANTRQGHVNTMPICHTCINTAGGVAPLHYNILARQG